MFLTCPITRRACHAQEDPRSDRGGLRDRHHAGADPDEQPGRRDYEQQSVDVQPGQHGQRAAAGLRRRHLLGPLRASLHHESLRRSGQLVRLTTTV